MTSIFIVSEEQKVRSLEFQGVLGPKMNSS